MTIGVAMRSSRFRYDINALRALAILGVIVFHFNSNWLAGGFAGVDVFFVISGFLMTRIIFRGLEQNNFKLFAFYVARVNRIIPALVFMCMLFLALGTIYLSPLDLASLARSTTYTLSFISNHQYLKETGYFDPAAQSKLLLHTWSLSVEWQFYLIYPLALLVLRQILSLVSIEKLIVVMTLIGFAIMQYYAHTNLSTAFYALHSRFWEMLVGGLAYCYPIKMPSNLQRIVSGSGIFAIVLS
jgi:peptidoglycan/LPS O-acetylase OafA/YrhL